MQAAREKNGSVKMDNPKPTMKPQIKPPGFFRLMACGLMAYRLILSVTEIIPSRMRFRNKMTTKHSLTCYLRQMTEFILFRLSTNYMFFQASMFFCTL